MQFSHQTMRGLMATLTQEKLKQLLAAELSLDEPEFRLEKVGGRLVGDVISKTFKGMADRDRQKLIWDVLQTRLCAESVKSVAKGIVAAAPRAIGLANVSAARLPTTIASAMGNSRIRNLPSEVNAARIGPVAPQTVKGFGHRESSCFSGKNVKVERL